MKSHGALMMGWTDRFVLCALRNQIRDADSPDYGGFYVANKGFSEPSQAARCIDVLLSAYYHPDSRYYRQQRLLESARLYASNLLCEQHEDGTLDLKETNFHDATAAAFAVQVLAYTYRLLAARSEGTHAESELADMLLQFLRQAAKGISGGGFHTPNHRWVMASALSLLWNVLGDERLREEAMLILREGIDCDEEGEYTERSVGIYNAVNNRSLIILSEELRMPELLQHVRRNLDMVLQYIEPDGTLFTLNSTRQDYGEAIYPIPYYDNYTWMAWKSRDRRFAAISQSLLRRADMLAQRADSPDSLIHALPFPHHLTQMLLNPELADAEATDEPDEPEERCERWFANSGVVRMRPGRHSSITLLENNSSFLKFQYGSNKVYMKFASSFFAKGQFKAESICKTDRGYRLGCQRDWGYVRPFPNGSASPVWEEMDHSSRAKVNMQHYEVTVDVIPEPDGVVLEIDAGGVAGLPCKLEWILEPGGMLETEDSILRGDEGRSVILKKGDAAYTNRGNRILLQGGFGEHLYTTDMRGSEPQTMNLFTVYMTAFTPFHRRVRIVAADPD